MIIYDEIKKSIKIAILNNSNNILDEVKEKLENEEFKYEIYEDVEKLLVKILKGRIKIVVLLSLDEELIDKINKNGNVCVVVIDNIEKLDYKSLKKINIQNIVPVDRLENELMYSLRIVSQSEKIDYQKFKLDIVGNLVESIAHQIQANLLIVGASLDVIKMMTSDEKVEKNKEKDDVINNLYSKNNVSLQKSNMLLELMSDATNVSSESIMQSEEVCDIINIIIKEYIKENEVNFNIDVRLKDGAYICGPLNDVIFIICKVIKEIVMENVKNITLKMYEDEEKWYFEIISDENIENKEKIVNISRYVTYIKDVRSKIKNGSFCIYVKKSK